MRACVLFLVALAAVACNGRVVEDPSSVPETGKPPTSSPPIPGERAASGATVLAALGAGNASSMTADETTLYVGMERGNVFAVPKTGGAPVELAAQGMARYPEGIAVDDTYVYVSSLTQRNVARIKKTGGPFEVIAEDLNRPYQVAIDATHVYFVDQGSVAVGGSGNDGRVFRVAKTGGAAEVLASGQQSPNAIALDQDNVYFASGPYGDTNGSIRVVAKSGGAVRVLARRLESIENIVLADDKVWFADRSATPNQVASRLAYVPIAGGDVVQTSADWMDPFGLASHGSQFFAPRLETSSNTATLRRFDATGHATATIATWSYARGVMPISSVATVIDDTHVFWVDLESSGDFGVRSTIRSAALP